MRTLKDAALNPATFDSGSSSSLIPTLFPNSDSDSDSSNSNSNSNSNSTDSFSQTPSPSSSEIFPAFLEIDKILIHKKIKFSRKHCFVLTIKQINKENSNAETENDCGTVYEKELEIIFLTFIIIILFIFILIFYMLCSNLLA